MGTGEAKRSERRGQLGGGRGKEEEGGTNKRDRRELGSLPALWGEREFNLDNGMSWECPLGQKEGKEGA